MSGLRSDSKQLICLQDLSNHRERIMPGSPAADGKSNGCDTLSPPGGQHNKHRQTSPIIVTPVDRSSLGNGETLSPVSGSNSAQQLPPACGARQLSKLKRFLTTLQQFGSDISPEIGDRVRSLVLGLVNSHISVEEFHNKLQEATNFPLRPFVIPFLKANLPLLQRELLHCARLARQSPQHFLTQNKHLIYDPTSHSPVQLCDPLDLNENGKRRSPDSKENGIDLHNESAPQPKRPHFIGTPGVTGVENPSSSYSLHTPISLDDMTVSREFRERQQKDRLDREQPFQFTPFNAHRTNDYYRDNDRLTDEWKQIDHMLNYIVAMVDRCRQAVKVMQEQSRRDSDEFSMWMRRRSDDSKRHSSESSSYRYSEEQVVEVKRRAEDAVIEVKRQAMAELQKAVTTAEAKAGELVAAERSKMDRLIADVRKQAHKDLVLLLNHQEDSTETCWNCGRKASETCSGCNVARYCGAFCQHKNWEMHHRMCGKNGAAAAKTVQQNDDNERAGGLVSPNPHSSSAASSSSRHTRQDTPSPSGSISPRTSLSRAESHRSASVENDKGSA